MTDKDQAIAPCPFCGHVGLDFNEGSTFRWLSADCTKCGATCGEVRIQTLGEGTKEEWMAQAQRDAIEVWNTRKTAPDWLLSTTQDLAKSIAKRCFPDVPQFEVLDDLAGVISQIDNMACGMERKPAPDCRTCDRQEFCTTRHVYDDCINGDQYQPAPALVLWRTK